MPTFSTPAPITLRFRLASGEIEISASDRQDTEVEVRPSNPNRSEDVEAAANTRVDQRDGTILIEAPEDHRSHRSPSLDIRVALPRGSHLRGSVASADVRASGQLGDVEINSASGDVQIEDAGQVTLQSASGDLFVRRADGDAKVQSASGDIALPTVGGSAQVSTASGDVELGEVAGDVRLQAASGDLQLRSADGSVEVKTASGDVNVGSVRQGEVSADAASGDIQIGVAAGTAAWLDVSSLSGDVRSALDQSDEPDAAERTVAIRARTLSGDISVVRAR